MNPDFLPIKGTKPAEADYPKPLDPLDDLPPQTVITSVLHQGGKLLVRGTTSDNGEVKRVMVSGVEARAVRGNFAEWDAIVPASAAETKLQAFAEDAAGNIEPRPHVLAWTEAISQPASPARATAAAAR